MFPVALHNRDVRLFTGGQCLSVLGTEITAVAMAWQVYLLTDSPLDVGILGLVRAVPQMGLLLYGGLLADAFDRRRLMMAMQAGQFLVSAALVMLSITGLVTPWALFIASGVLGVFTALETPSRQAFVPALVPREDIANALALQNALRKVGAVAGPAIGGVVLTFADPLWCYAVDATSWLCMLSALGLITLRAEPSARRGTMSLSSLGEGLRFVVTHPIILAVMGLDFGATLFGLPNALFPVYARDILHAGAAGLGVLYAAVALGGIIGGITMSVTGGLRKLGMGVLAGVTVYGVAIALFALSTNLWVSAFLLLVSGIGNAASAVLRWTIVQVMTPDDLRGRVSAAGSIFTSGGPKLGEFRGGAAAHLWGAEFSALSGGLLTIGLAALVALLHGVRHFEIRPAGGATQHTVGQDSILSRQVGKPTPPAG